MNNIIVAFITGLTTGGLSCLAVQGGLLASSVAQEVEESVQARPSPSQPDQRRKKQRLPQPQAGHPLRASRPILLFLAAKLAAYTILGFLLGLLGSVLQLTPTMQAVLQVAIGVFMLGTALRMLNVHPIFRYFTLQPPAAVTRFIRRTSKGNATAATPLFLGALTVLIPCGVTQAMMAVAIGSGNPVTAATTMFAFILGTSTVFFAVFYLATKLGARLEAGFMRVVAVVVLLLAFVSIDSGLTLMGWPYSIANLRLALAGASAEGAPAEVLALEVPTQAPLGNGPAKSATPSGTGYTLSLPAATAGAPDSSVQITAIQTISVRDNGYNPRVVHAKPNQPLKLSLVTNKTYSCARAFVIPSLRIEKMLPPTGTVLIDIPAQKVGSRLYFSCSMGMYSGVIIFDS